MIIVKSCPRPHQGSKVSKNVAGLVARVVAALPLVRRGREDMEVLPTLCSPTTCSWLARALVVWEPASSKLSSAQTINTYIHVHVQFSCTCN